MNMISLLSAMCHVHNKNLLFYRFYLHRVVPSGGFYLDRCIEFCEVRAWKTSLRSHIYQTQVFKRMDLAALLYNYERGVVENKGAILEKVVEDSMAPLYEQLCAKFNWDVDQSVLKTLRCD